jgi:uncharacterized membrane protein
MERHLNVLLAGESWITQTTHIKGVDYFTQSGYGEGTQWLRRAIEGGGHTLEHLPNHLAMEKFPSAIEELASCDVLILSDIGANTLLLHPETTMFSKVTPNRLETIRQYVEGGGALIMIGGYMSFQGIEGKARYHSTPVEEALPVTMLPGLDDRMEMPQGFRAVLADGADHHPVMSGLPNEFPTMLFYNQVRLKPEATLLLHYDGAPILAVGEYGRGRSAAFTPDAAPHGAPPEFLDWAYFDRFWQQLLTWLTTGSGAREEVRESMQTTV